MNIKQPVAVFAYDILVIPISWFLAYSLRYNFEIPDYQIFQALNIFGVLFPLQLIFYFYFGLYRGIWRFASVPDLVRIVKAVLCGAIATMVLLLSFTHLIFFSRSIFPLYVLLSIFFLGGARISYRHFKEHINLKTISKRVLIVGAGNAGEGIARDLLRDKTKCYLPIAFVDDARYKYNKEIHGIKVAGTSNDIAVVVKNYNVDLIIIAIPSLGTQEMQRVVNLCIATKVPFKTLPNLSEIEGGVIRVNDIREVAIEDLLGRDQVDLDRDEIEKKSYGRVALVSGGGGSIGSELCRQIARLNPHLHTLVVIERSEFNLYKLHQEIAECFPDLHFVAYLGSVTDKVLVKRVFEQHHPDAVFHAAAYKHVPILEQQVYNAIYNNVWGTKVLAEAAIASGTKKFVLVSTDKAVRPANVMGATKRVAEIICQNLDQVGGTRFVTVRFGNVLGSSGSVIPLFKQQLAEGKPVTITHPEITRFFMTIPEAAQLIIEACVIGQGGEIFVLDMGEPVKIQYLAEQLIKLSGKTLGIDAEISYIGLRPGEKLYEELFYQNEEVVGTRHPKILQAKSSELNGGFNLSNLETIFCETNEIDLYNMLRKLVPEFKPNN